MTKHEKIAEDPARKLALPKAGRPLPAMLSRKQQTAAMYRPRLAPSSEHARLTLEMTLRRLRRQLRTEIVEANGLRIAYRLAGSGPPLVLVHGYMATSVMWAPKSLISVSPSLV